MQLTISNLSKTYPNGVTALNRVSLQISTGMYGLVGPNGAGKSTLMRTIATLQEADAGSVRLDDLDVLQEKDAVRRLLGYLPQEFGLYPKLERHRYADAHRHPQRHQRPRPAQGSGDIAAAADKPL